MSARYAPHKQRWTPVGWDRVLRGVALHADVTLNFWGFHFFYRGTPRGFTHLLECCPIKPSRRREETEGTQVCLIGELVLAYAVQCSAVTRVNSTYCDAYLKLPRR